MRQIQWQADLDASCWHAARAIERGLPLIDDGLAALGGDLEAIRSRLAPRGEAAFAEELRLRARPLREQWEARGPGLLRQIERLTEPSTGRLPVPVQLTPPIVGGHGEVRVGAGSVTFEAVLANPIAALPEVLRLGWLIAQLGASGGAGGHFARVGPLAFAPAVLAAGAELDLCGPAEETLPTALAAWRVDGASEGTARRVLGWWRDYRESPTPWIVAVAALADRS